MTVTTAVGQGSTAGTAYTITITGTPSGATPADEVAVYTLTVLTAATHDVAVNSVNASPLNVVRPPDTTVTITVVVQNNGNVAETFDVTAKAGSMTVGTKTVTSLAPGATAMLTYALDTSTVPDGSYLITATASTVPGETNTANNTASDGTLTIRTTTLTCTATLTVSGPFTSNPSAIFVTETVHFDASGSSCARDGTSVPISSYAWDFNSDGITDMTTTTPILDTKPYFSTGTFTATVTVTAIDSFATASASASQTVTVQPEPRLAHGKLSWTHHEKASAGQDQTFTAVVSNPSTLTVYVYVQIVITPRDGSTPFTVFIQDTDGTGILLSPGQLTKNLSVTVSASTFKTGIKYDLTATIWYNIDDAIVGTGSGVNGYLVGNSKSGAFAVV